MAAVVINVTSPAGPDSPDNPIFLFATEPLVVGTPFLDWRPAPAGAGGAARVSLATFQAIRAFLPRANISRVPADVAAATAVGALSARLTDACWSRILTELVAADILSTSPNDLSSLWDAMALAVLPNPTSLELVAGDWRATQAFVIPAGPGPANVALRTALTPIRFLSIITVNVMEAPTHSLPLEGMCLLIGALGPCQVQAARRLETASVQLVAATIRASIPNGPSLSNGQLAIRIIPFLRSKRLPVQLRPAGVIEQDLREELEDGIEYRQSDEGRKAVEERRIFNLGRRCYLRIKPLSRSRPLSTEVHAHYTHKGARSSARHPKGVHSSVHHSYWNTPIRVSLPGAYSLVRHPSLQCMHMHTRTGARLSARHPMGVGPSLLSLELRAHSRAAQSREQPHSVATLEDDGAPTSASAFARRPNLSRFILNKSRDATEAYGCIRRLRLQLLDKEVESLTLVEVIDSFEERLSDRRHVLTEAEAKAGSTADSITTALLDELRNIRTSGGDPASVSTTAASPVVLDVTSIESALTGSHSASFRRLATQLAAIDTTTVAGQRDALAIGFEGTCIVALRILFASSEKGDPLATRHAALGQLNELRQHRLAYLNHQLCLDPITLSVPDKYRAYSLANFGTKSSAVFDGWFSLALESTDFVSAPHGVLGLLQARDGKSMPYSVNPIDYTCQPALITELCRFLQILGNATLQLPAAIDGGFTFVSFGEWYNQHLMRALRCGSSQEAATWLRRAAECWQSAMLAIGKRLRSLLYGRLDGSTVTFVLNKDCDELEPLRTAEKLQDKTADVRAEIEFLTGASSSAAPPSLQLPLLSSFSDSSSIKKRKAPGDELPPADGGTGLPSGSLTQSYRFTGGGNTLIQSGRAWNLRAIAQHCGATTSGIDAIEWPVALFLGEEKNKAARCKRWGQPGHDSPNSVCHVLIVRSTGQLADLTALRERFSREASAQEREGLILRYVPPNRPGARGRGDGRGRGRGQRGRGTGRGRGRTSAGEPGDEEQGVGQQPFDPPLRDAEEALGGGIASSTLRGLLGGDGLSALIELVAADLGPPEALGDLPRPHGPPGLATPIGFLSSPLRTLAHRLKPSRFITDQGGAGQCGPNTLTYLLGMVGLTEVDGPQLRLLIRDHASKETTLASSTSVLHEDDSPVMMRELIKLNIEHWPTHALQGKPRTIATWAELIVLPETWTDVAFTQLTSDLFQVSFHLIGVDDLSSVFDMGTISPCNGVASVALCEIGVWYNRHFVAILDCDLSAAAEAGQPSEASPDLACDPPPCAFPLTTVAAVKQLLARPSPPTALVGFEFSGAMRSALEREGIVAISADFRPCEVGGLHYLGDACDLLDIQVWARAYFFPPCFQQLRGDLDCLPCKIDDGRAFWGCALVLHVLFTVTALMVCVEQPDTLVADCFDPYDWPDTKVYEFRTAHYGDSSDKFVRLTTRNVRLEAPQHADRQPPPLPRSQFDYADAEARDRARSTWRQHPKTCAALAGISPVHEASPTTVPFVSVIEAFAVEWHLAFGRVPSGYRAPTALPPSPEARTYQKERGPGDGRKLQTVKPITLSGAHVRIRRDGNIVPFESDPTALDAGEERFPLLGSVDAGEEVNAEPLMPSSPEMLSLEHLEPPPPLCTDQSTVDIRTATEATAILLFICVLGQPLALAHLDGFTALGISAPASTRSAMLARMKLLSALFFSAVQMVFMVGHYLTGLALFASPVDFAPPASQVCRSRAQRLAWLARGVTFAWCSLAALRGTPIADAAGRAFATSEMFRGPVAELPDEPSPDGVLFKFGASASRSALKRPAAQEGTPLWSAFQEMLANDQLLADSILADVADGGTLLEGWAERIQPFDVSAIPQDLLDHAPTFDDNRLDGVPLDRILAPLRTPWLPRPPRQMPAGSDAPRCPRPPDLLLQQGVEKIERWLDVLRLDLTSIRDQLADGVPPTEVHRHRMSSIAVGQSETQPWARDRVWDCRGPCCIVSDFQAPMETHFKLPYLRSRLQHYPDQFLVANLLEGVRLDADVELQAVFVPHLTSLPLGFASVERELRRLHSLGWYDFFEDMPFYPMYFNGQGTTARKLEPDRHRRTTEGSGPRQPTFDESGLQAISLNEASHIYHMPQHFLRDLRPEFQAWLRARGLPAQEPFPASASTRFTKWPKEQKPGLIKPMRDNAVFKRAGKRLEQPCYGFGDDAKDYFNQLAMCPCELHKLGIIFLAQDSDFPQLGRPPEGPKLLFVSEKRLGFGTHGASNIAQRFSDALLHLYREDMDAADAEARGTASPAELSWLQVRLDLQRRLGEPCSDVRRWTARPQDLLPDIAAPTRVSDIPPGYVCPQLRLYACYYYTDDPQFHFVSVERTKRGLRVWRRLTEAVGLIMAIPEKRSLGSWSKWIGAFLLFGLGIVVVPREKILRASAVISDVLSDGVEFHVYRALLGLLEHLRAVNLQPRNIMYGLYRPHGPNGASRHGPSGWVTCDLLMTKQLQRWQSLLFRSCGVSSRRAILREEIESRPRITIDVTSDACLADVERAGIGGFCHGLFWFFEIPEDDRPFLTIPVLEYLGVGAGLLNLYSYLYGALQTVADVTILARTDALTTALVLPEASANSEVLQEVDDCLRGTPEWQQLQQRLRVAHLYGDCNWAGDLISRQRWEEFFRLCALLAIRPRRAAMTPAAKELVAVAVRAGRRIAHSRQTGDRARMQTRRMRVSFATSLVGSANPLSPALQRRLLAEAVIASPPPGREIRSAGIPAPALQRRLAMEPSSPALPRWLATEPSVEHPQQAALARTAVSGPSHPPPGVQATRTLGGLAMPPRSPSLQRTSALAIASRHYSRQQLQRFTEGDPDMAFKANFPGLLAATEAVDDAIESGVNPNTAKFDERAWDFFEHVCEKIGTNPCRTEKEVRENPERNAHLLAMLVLHAYAVCKPKSKRNLFIKPSSALAYALAIIRIFGRWGVKMPGYPFVAKAVDGLKRGYIAYHGTYSLAPKRAENMTFAMVMRLHRIPIDGSITIGALPWSDTVHDVFIFRRLIVFMMFTAFRLGEVVGNATPEIMYLTWSSLMWFIGGVYLRVPSRQQLLAMRPGIDGVLCFPPRSKPDQWGEIHCPFPVRLTFEQTELNPCAALRDLELRIGPGVIDRDTQPLFGDASGIPYTHAYLHTLLRTVIAHLYGPTIAALYTWHSFRSGLATALHAAGVEDSMIMLICRWMCAESLHLYRRMGTREHEKHINAASGMNVSAIQSTNVVKVDGHPEYAALFADLSIRTSQNAKLFVAAAEEPATQRLQVAPPAEQLRTPPTAQPTTAPLRLKSLTVPVRAGDEVVIPAGLWPRERCSELGGQGWAGTVERSFKAAARVSFLHARTRDGRAYESVLIPLDRLMTPA